MKRKESRIARVFVHLSEAVAAMILLVVVIFGRFWDSGMFTAEVN